MDKKTKNILYIITFGVILFAVAMNFSDILPLLGKAVSLVMPVIVGGIIAIFINVPVSAIKNNLKKLFKKAKREPSENTYQIVSFILTVIIAALVVFVVFTMVIPAISESVKSLYYQIQERIPVILEYLKSHDIDYKWFEETIAGINLDNIIKRISDTLGTVIGGVANAVSSTINVAATTVFSIIIAIYATLDKNRVVRHTKTLVNSYVREDIARKTIKFSQVFSKTFSKFLSGQCTEAVILGLLMFIVFMVFRLPYAPLVGALTAFCAIIPYIGAFISCTVSTLLIALVSPVVAIKALIIYLIVQFTENQFIYPRVVGGNVGLTPLYTLIAALVGGKLFGIIGILFFIPLAAAVMILVKEDLKATDEKTTSAKEAEK